MKQPYNTALYMRLSRDDENFGDSVSIETQRTILRQFAKENNLRVYDEYIDDGWSGTNFDRPNFRRMMADVEAGKVNCIASKDLSRFGREHIMMDYYLESMRDFELTFVCEPFAYGSILTVPLASGRNRVSYGGTAETPAVIVLKNTSETEATNVTITAIKRS